MDVTVKVSYIEVYKEELRDLLQRQTTHKELHIREDERGNTGNQLFLPLLYLYFSIQSGNKKVETIHLQR